ncbi:hypothetical protein [Flavobacterium koreense]
MSQVLVTIRPHLIPFFFEEMEGTLASYEGQKVNMIRLLPSSSLANYLYTQINYVKKNSRNFPNDQFLFYLSIQYKQFYILSGTVYLDQKGERSELKMELDKVRDLNNLLEDIFRTSLVMFVDGCRAGRLGVSKSVLLFMEKYNLIEYGFEVPTMRKMYYEQKKKKVLNRFQKRSTNQVIGFF